MDVVVVVVVVVVYVHFTVHSGLISWSCSRFSQIQSCLQKNLWRFLNVVAVIMSRLKL